MNHPDFDPTAWGTIERAIAFCLAQSHESALHLAELAERVVPKWKATPTALKGRESKLQMHSRGHIAHVAELSDQLSRMFAGIEDELIEDERHVKVRHACALLNDLLRRAWPRIKRHHKLTVERSLAHVLRWTRLVDAILRASPPPEEHTLAFPAPDAQEPTP